MYDIFFYDDVTYNIIDIFNETSSSSNINRKLDKLYKEKILNEEKCSICQENMIGYIKLKSCHNFHKSCIKEWFKVKQSCPLCRAEFINEIKALLHGKLFVRYLIRYRRKTTISCIFYRVT